MRHSGASWSTTALIQARAINGAAAKLVQPFRERSLHYAGHITVESATGARYQVHQYRGRRLFRLVSRFVLETGQRVQCLDFDHYVIARTGEPLSRVQW